MSRVHLMMSLVAFPIFCGTSCCIVFIIWHCIPIWLFRTSTFPFLHGTSPKGLFCWCYHQENQFVVRDVSPSTPARTIHLLRLQRLRALLPRMAVVYPVSAAQLEFPWKIAHLDPPPSLGETISKLFRILLLVLLLWLLFRRRKNPFKTTKKKQRA